MASETEICNMALYRTGVSQAIGNLTTEQSTEARICRLFYPQRRDSLLQEMDWNFNRKRAPLAQLTDTPPTNWAYVYALPDDCLAVRALVVEGDRHPVYELTVPHEIAGRYLYCDLETVEIVYSARVTDTSFFDPLFVDLLSLALVPDLAMGLAVKGEIVQMARQQYMVFWTQAAAAHLNQGFDLDKESEFIRVR